jgi:Ca2+-binding RTX toxin-like protein
MNGVFGTMGHDTIVGDENTNFIFGNDGNDDITAGGDIDLITPGPGDDNADGGSTDGSGFDLDIVYFTDAPQGVIVDLQNNVATGDGNDSITNFESVYGSKVDDDITGDQDSNILFGGPGNDTMDGGGGPETDYAAYWFAGNAITANLMTNTATGEGTDTLNGFEGLLGTIGHNDNLTGDNQDNYLDGDLGDDVLNGEGGDDLFLGGEGNDTMNGGAGNFDMADYFCVCNLNANLQTGVITGHGTDGVSGIEAVGAADGNDTLIGDGADNVFFGWGGNDVIQGMEGNDELDGGIGSNNLSGGIGNDLCVNATTTDGACETTTGSVTDHPLRLATELVSNLRRNF